MLGQSTFQVAENPTAQANQIVQERVIESAVGEDLEDASIAQSASISNAVIKISDEKDSEKQVLQNLERFIQRIRMVAHQIVQGTLVQFDPDQDGYLLNLDEALQLHKNVNVLHYVRRSLLTNKAKQFE